ncbi:Sir2 family NAD-dependent protein deacetylase [Nocardioides sambongensis]|uniref:Sir2 family NAD-dependent protein deacetylase n=1 Tax=Nocardioides sambongensis TaxID=2589074 RepID=UPI0022AB85B3|nr:Sir2 family NAD-dependent protein deacetylase [Nocardioides sambongensis]
MTFGEFTSGPVAQQRYWARSHLGWSRMRRADPNPGHRAVAALGADLVITQNVDGLHEACGTPGLVALHGRIADVVCLDCRATSPRQVLQQRMAADNPGWAQARATVEVRPDGDVDLEETSGFVVPACGGVAGS